MRKVNLSMVMLLCFACATLIYLIAAQQSLTSASPMRLQDDPTNTATATATQSGETYFVTATLPGQPGGVIATEDPNANGPVIVVPGEGATFIEEDAGPSEVQDEGGRMATPTRTPTPINVGNFVWDDIDKDGRQDAGEPGLAGVTVQLWNTGKSYLYGSTTTNASGIYTLVAPLPGSYRVRVVLPGVGDTFTDKNQAAGDDQLDSDVNPTGINAGFTDIYTFASNLISITTIDTGIIIYRTPTPTRTPTPINVGNFVWDDIDKDGRQDAGEPGLAGVQVQLWNSGKTALLDSTTTNASGIYTLVAPLPGSYRVRAILPGNGDTFTDMDEAGGDDLLDSDINPSGANLGFTDIYTFASNLISITTIDIGIIIYRTPTPTRTPTPINVGNFVWDDLNENGQQDAGEPGLAGVTVQLWNSGKTYLYGQTQTNASGIYALVAPLPGSYRVRVVLPAPEDEFTLKDVGNDLLDSDINPTGTDLGFTDIYTLASNVISITSIDIGIITADPIPLGNRVWHDTNGNGIQETGEQGIAGRTVRLRRHGAIIDITVSTDVTDADGTYTVVAPEPGTYYICVVVNSAELISPMNISDGGFLPDLRDSDIYPTVTGNGRGCTADITVVNDSIMAYSYDAGLYSPHASLSGLLTMQGRPAAPHATYIVPVRVRIVPSGGGSAIFDSYVTTNNTGGFDIGAFQPGSYVVWVKHDHSLANRLTVTLGAGDNVFNFGTLREGDASNDNIVSLVDFSLLVSTFNKALGDAGYDARADLNNDNVVNLTDFSLLVTNYSQAGEAMP